MESTATEAQPREDPQTALHWMVFCPERRRLATVEIAARAAPFATFCCPRLSITQCSFWPEAADCPRACLHSNVEAER